MPLKALARNLEKGCISSLSGLTFEALLFVLDCHKGPFCVLTELPTVERVAVLYQERIGADVVCLAPQGPSPAGPIDLYYSSSFVSIQRVASGIKDGLLCFVDRSLFGSPIIPVESPVSFLISGKTSFRVLLVRLEELGYQQKEDVLVPGSFLVRGGVVDVFLFHSNQIFRVSFLQKDCVLYVVNKHNNKINREVSSLLVFPKLKKNKVSLESFLPAQYNIYTYTKGRLQHHKKEDLLPRPAVCLPLGYQSFIKKTGEKKIFSLDFLYERGFEYQKVLFLPSWFTKTKKVGVFKQKTQIDTFGALKVGGIYVHEDFGFCCFLGFKTTKEQEKLCLQFADGLVKIDIDYISKLSFVASKTKKALSFLNKPGVWSRKKSLAEKQAAQFVGALIKAYAKREGLSSSPLIVSDEMIDFFVRSFQYKITPDQQSCWEAILKDLGGAVPMNRLICGDVGFGKTELAIRASFVSVFNNQQVLVLAPTTILANQLYHSFLTRLSEFGVSVGCLSRITSNKAGVLFSYLNKKTDVLVGTVALLFQIPLLRQCGLFVVDEEHRFGVQKKELVFQHNPSVNFLSMSATPIPRSLQLSLSNVRNLSLIQTPPLARKPIISSVNYFSEKLIKTIILKEVSRKGQVFFVDSSIPRLQRLFARFLELFPFLTIDILFGSLESKKLIGVMDSFVCGKTQILLSTTIIESGIDVGATNTIIINNAHLFGLSQLYQLRGRVGRSSLQAFAWFLVPKNKKISLDGKKRLQTIVQHSALGSGYQVAQSDLEIRGSGALFGYQQSGDGGVGFEYYTKLLSQVVNKNKKKSCLVRLFPQTIPRAFLSQDNERAFYYKKIFSAETETALKQLQKDLVDLFGVCIPEMEGLIKNRLLALRAAKKCVVKIFQEGENVSVSFNLKKTDPGIDVLVSYITSFFTSKKIDFWFVNSYKHFIFQYKSLGKDDYILLLSFINKISFF